MATENSTLPVSEEHLNSSVVEDTQNNSVPADGGETNAAVADDTDVPTQSRVDFADEDAALAAENAGLDLGEASPEEEAAGGEAAGSDLAGKSKEELLAIFAKMLEERPVQSLRRDVEALKIAFYKLRRAESDAARRAFVEAGGGEGDFVSEPDPAELRFKDLFREYRRLRDEFVAGLEAAKEENLKIKLQIIEELKELASSDEMLNQTFNKFRELQHRWKETGVVPQQNVKDLWETYNLHVENFYNFIKINKELRDLDLKKNYDAIDWKYLFDFAKINPERVIVCQPEYMEALDKLIEITPIEDLRYYLASQYLNAAAPYLDDNFYAASFDFYGRTMSGKQEPRPRWKRAMAIPNSALGEAVGEMYVEKFFPAEDKARMMTLVENLRTALGQHIDQLDWMSDSTKMRAREKLAAFHVKIGYPDKWKDYSTLEIDPTLSYWENIQRASEWATRDQLAKVGKAVDPEEWLMTPQTVNAYYNPTTNEICFPAAILQPPFFNPAADDAVNYGAIGVVIGHEMTHGFDDQGRQFDKDGNMNNWWTDADAEAFKQKTDILVKQFDAIEVLPARGDQPAVFANGSLCLGENIADQGGLRVAYTALMNTLNGTEPEPIDGLTPAQRFYLSYATVWAQNIRDEEIARLTKLDVHSLGQWRVDATLRNLQDFFDAFNITDGKMYMPVEERVIIW